MRAPRPLSNVRLVSIRVALIATAIVAAVYLVISVAVAVIVTSRLTGNVDTRVVSGLNAAASGQFVRVRVAGLGLAEYMWYVAADGTQYACSTQGAAQTGPLPGSNCGTPTANQKLPAADLSVGSPPQTVSIGGTDFRVAGSQVPPGAVINTWQTNQATGVIEEVQHPVTKVFVGETLATVESAQSNIILAEGIIGPVLLIVVFLGALTIGRRVAAPIELTRIRQLEFTADASHELRTPLSVIEAQTSLALAEPRQADWYRNAFQRVQGESARIRRLVEDLLWLARFDSTRHDAQAEHVDVAILARQAADRFLAIAEAKHVGLSVRTAPVPLIVHAPPEWLDRLLGVLLDNACKYVPEGGAVDVAVWPEGSRVRLAVDDSGPGIPAEERPRIFDRFHRATERPGGAGLGLAIANSVVQATGGRWIIGDSALGGVSMGVSWARSLAGPASAPLPEMPEPAGRAPSPQVSGPPAS
jgi:two-component system sensor histidine kinase CiaH